MCEVLDVSTSGYYASLDRPPSPRAQRHERIKAAVPQVHAESHGIYGSLKIARALATAGRSGVGLPQHGGPGDAGIGPEKPHPQSVHADDHPSRSDEVSRPPTRSIATSRPTAPNRKWVTDITYLPTAAGLGLPGRGARPVQPQSRRLGDRRLVGDGARCGSPANERSNRGGPSARNCCTTATAAASTRTSL